MLYYRLNFSAAMKGLPVSLTIENDCSEIDWIYIHKCLKNVGMAHYTPEMHRKAFEASYATVFVYENNQLLGFGRAISDGEYQAAIYDVAVLPACQGKGVGKIIMKELLNQLPNCNIILYATPGMEGFYKKLGFAAMKTGMALFTTAEAMEKFTN